MRFKPVKELQRASDIILEQQDIIRQLKAEVRVTEVAYMRISRDLIEQFLIALDTPENNEEIRQRLTTGLGFYRDEIAVREEHV